MKVIAVDPGTTMSGWCLIENGLPVDWGWHPNEQVKTMLAKITRDARFSDQEEPLLVIESIAFYGRAVGKDVFRTVWWSGRFVEAHGGMYVEMPRTDVKMALLGQAKGTDAEIRAAVQDIYGGKEIAVGGKKCGTCKGEGTQRKLGTRGRKGVAKERIQCDDCHCGGDLGATTFPFDDWPDLRGCGFETHPGPLNSIKGQHVYDALAAGIAWIQTNEA